MVEEQLVYSQFSARDGDIELFEYKLMDLRLRSAAFYGSKGWVKGLSLGIDVSEEDIISFFTSKDPSLRLSCKIENFINIITGAL